VKTKGALIREFNQPWTIEEIEIGDPAKNEVKIQMEASGMCHSDHHLVTGGIPMFGFPVLGGHEGAGIVTEIGEGVESVAVGDHVVLSFIPSCGKCPSCQAGLRNLCDLGAGLLAGVAITVGIGPQRRRSTPDRGAPHLERGLAEQSAAGTLQLQPVPARPRRPGQARQWHTP
jgi:S-(hydroxymethyl)glutathione dehydrogenase/alcohol dehydrogenase